MTMRHASRSIMEKPTEKQWEEVEEIGQDVKEGTYKLREKGKKKKKMKPSLVCILLTSKGLQAQRQTKGEKKI